MKCHPVAANVRTTGKSRSMPPEVYFCLEHDYILFSNYSLDWPSDHLSLAFSCCKRPQYDPPERFSMLIDLS